LQVSIRTIYYDTLGSVPWSRPHEWWKIK